jgi:hypothetical protein
MPLRVIISHTCTARRHCCPSSQAVNTALNTLLQQHNHCGFRCRIQGCQRVTAVTVRPGVRQRVFTHGKTGRLNICVCVDGGGERSGSRLVCTYKCLDRF